MKFIRVLLLTVFLGLASCTTVQKAVEQVDCGPELGTLQKFCNPDYKIKEKA